MEALFTETTRPDAGPPPVPAKITDAGGKPGKKEYTDEEMHALYSMHGYRYDRGMIRERLEVLRRAADRAKAEVAGLGVRFEAIAELAELADTSENHRVRLRALELLLREMRRFFADQAALGGGQDDGTSPDTGTGSRKKHAERSPELGHLALELKSSLAEMEQMLAGRRAAAGLTEAAPGRLPPVSRPLGPPLNMPLSRQERRRLERDQKKAEKKAARQELRADG